MNGKHYVGKRVSDFVRYNDIGPITGVEVFVDKDTSFTSGDLSGYVFTVECTYGTQEMADTMLVELYGKTYRGFRADGAVLAPEAELGDGVTVDGLYTMLAYRSVTFGQGHLSEISAPGDNELTHEYQYTSTSKKNLSDDTESLRAFLQRSLGEMQISLNSLKSQVESLASTVSAISNTVTDLEHRVSALEGR